MLAVIKLHQGRGKSVTLSCLLGTTLTTKLCFHLIRQTTAKCASKCAAWRFATFRWSCVAREVPCGLTSKSGKAKRPFHITKAHYSSVLPKCTPTRLLTTSTTTKLRLTGGLLNPLLNPGETTATCAMLHVVLSWREPT